LNVTIETVDKDQQIEKSKDRILIKSDSTLKLWVNGLQDNQIDWMNSKWTKIANSVTIKPIKHRIGTEEIVVLFSDIEAEFGGGVMLSGSTYFILNNEMWWKDTHLSYSQC